MKFRAFEQIKIIKYQWAGITVCFTILKFTGKLGARQSTGETLTIIYCGCGIEQSFASGENWQLRGNVLSEEVHVKSPLVGNCWHKKRLWLCSRRGLSSEQAKSDLALSLAEVRTVRDLCCPDAAGILKEGREGAGNMGIFHMVSAQEKRLSDVACGGNCI